MPTAARPLARAGNASLVAYALGLLVGAAVLVGFGFVDELRSHIAVTDFAGFWAGPRALLDGADPYDPQTWQATIARLGTQETSELVYGYPPWVLIALLPLGLLPLGVATAVWTAGGLALAIIGIWSLLRVVAPDYPLLAALAGLCLLASSPAIIAFYSGQWSFLLVGSVALGYALLLRRRERSAGILAPVMLIKPHLFVLAAIGLLRASVARRWTNFLGTATTGIALILVAALVFCTKWILTWLALIPGTRAGTAGTVTLPNALADLVGSPGQWLGVAVLAAAVALALAFDPRADASLAVWTSLSFAAVVYGWSYDHVLLLVPFVLASGLARRRSLVRGRIVTGLASALVLVGEILLYQVAVSRGNQSFSAFVPAAFAALVIAGLWPLRHATRAADR